MEFGAGFRSEGGQVYIKSGDESVTCFSKAGISGDKMQTLMWSWALCLSTWLQCLCLQEEHSDSGVCPDWDLASEPPHLHSRSGSHVSAETLCFAKGGRGPVKCSTRDAETVSLLFSLHWHLLWLQDAQVGVLVQNIVMFLIVTELVYKVYSVTPQG